MIPQEVIQEILSRTDIRQVIAPYVTLQRAGTNYKGLCPFHSEKTPSFTVFPADNSFYCFGCGAGGDAISFIRRAENLDYVGAVERLAQSVGITIPEQPDAYGNRPKFDRKRLYEMNRCAARFFHNALRQNTPGAREAYEYLHVKRGLTDATITHFGLGYAPNEYGAMSRYLTKEGFTLDEMIAGNLCGRDPETGRVYDAFYRRVMFPIIDVTGNVIAFGGRVMDGSQPKYKNSADTPIYNKRRNIYALNFAKDHCGEEMILCEGYMDVIALHAAGFPSAVATLGTAITPEHARLMKRYTKRVLISYDMDEAGRNAANKAMRMLEEVGLEVRLLRMRDAKDPDEFIRKFGQDAFRSVLNESSSKFDYNMERILSKYVLSDAQDVVSAAKEVCGMIAEIDSAAERDVYIRVAAERLGISPASMKDDVERLRRKKLSEGKKREVQTMRQQSLGFSDKVNPDYVKIPTVARLEETVLGLMLLRPEYIVLVREGSVALTTEHFLTVFNRRVFEEIIQYDNGYFDQSLFTEDEVGRIVKMRVSRMELSDNGEEVFRESVENLKTEGAKKGDGAKPQTTDDLVSYLNNLSKKQD